MKKNICIIHFNTPVLTRCLVQSINKYTPDANIYIFDNSDKSPFINIFDNVTVLDNTKGQIVNFDEVLAKFTMRVKSRGKTNNYGSAKHSISIQKCVDMFDNGFVLLDSDVLLKRDISQIWNEDYVWIAGVEDWQNKTLVGAKKRKRVCPFILYMNTKKMKEIGIAFYDDTHMLGFNNGPKCEEYETGVWFYEATPKDKRRIINYNDYIVHFRAGSWLNDARTKQRYKQIEPEKWLTKYKKYWTDANAALPKDWYKQYGKVQQQKMEEIEKPKHTMETIDFNKFFDHIYCLHYLPDESRLPKIKDELNRVGINEDADYFSWVYDYPSSVTDMVYNNGGLNMNQALKSSSRKYIKKVSMKHYEIMKEAYSLGYERILILENDVRFHKDLDYINKMLANMPDTDIVMFDKMTCSAPSEPTKYKKYVKTLPSGALYGNMKDSGVFFIFCSCYSVNRSAMKRIIELHETGLLPPDTPLNDKSITGSFAITNLAIQDPKLKTRKIESYDKIGLDIGQYETYNENVPKQEETAIPLAAKQASKKALEKKISTTHKAQNFTRKVAGPKKVIHLEPVKKITPFKHAAPKRKVVAKKKPTKTRTIFGNTSSYNKFYDL